MIPGRTPRTPASAQFGTAAEFGTYNWVFDALGVGAINVNAFASAQNGIFRIDGSAYTGNGGAFTLIDSSNLTAGSSDVQINGFDSGLDSTVLTQNVGSGAGNGDVILTVTAIPEPSFLSLSGLAFGLLVLRRRRA